MTRILAVVAACLLCWYGLAQASMISDLDSRSISTNGTFEDARSLDASGLTGLDRANQVAGEHGQQGREIAALHHATISAPNRSPMTHLVDSAPLTIINGAIIDNQTPASVTSATAGPLAYGSGVIPGIGMFSTLNAPNSTGTLNGLTDQTVASVTEPASDPPKVVPEPNLLLLIGSGLVGVWFSRMREN
ncbi:MAG TPA: PEP-CTERM sorting domain-containing protein [Nitrospira sp.]|nr:PEP-CTERM sorting domain-containing protein [Nitrospira sp.]